MIDNRTNKYRRILPTGNDCRSTLGPVIVVEQPVWSESEKIATGDTGSNPYPDKPRGYVDTFSQFRYRGNGRSIILISPGSAATTRGATFRTTAVVETSP